MIIIENKELNKKLEKEKILKVVKDLKKRKYLENKKKKLIKQNKQNYAQKILEKIKNSKIEMDIMDIDNKFFPFTPGTGLIVNSKNIFNDSKDYNEERLLKNHIKIMKQ